QVDVLDRLVRNHAVTIPIYLRVSTEVMRYRLGHRIICDACGWVGKASCGNACPLCGSFTHVRADDLVPESVSRRISSFEHEIEGVLHRYRMSGRLVVVDGEESPSQILQRILAIAQTRGTEMLSRVALAMLPDL